MITVPRFLPNSIICLAAAGLLLACSDDDGGQNDNTDGSVHTLCGNGEVEGPEECDNGTANSDTVPDACRSTCVLPHCGDGVADSDETCDHGAQNSDEVPDACRTDCASPICGDGVVDVVHGEGCDCGDGTGTLPGRCTEPNSLGETASCRPDCSPAGCGDGLLQGNELCDGTQIRQGASCLDYGRYHGELACTDACSYDTTGCHDYCGDGVLDLEHEVCDTAAPSGRTCLSYGFDFGTLGCSVDCTPGFDECGFIGFHPVFNTAGLNVWSIWADAPDNVFAAYASTPEGGVLHFDGATWSDMTMPQDAPSLMSIWGVSSTELFAVGEDRVLFYDGTQWTELATHTDRDLRSVWGTAPDHAIVLGETDANTGVALHWDGSAWTEHPLPSVADSPMSVWGAAPDDVFAVYIPGVSHWDGTAWSPMTLPAPTPLLDVWGTASNDVYAVGSGPGSVPLALHWDGTDWEAMDVPPPSTGAQAFWAVWGSASDDVYAVGPAGLAMHWDGERWTELHTGTSQFLVGLWGTGPDHLLTSTQVGEILRYWGVGWSSDYRVPSRTFWATHAVSPLEVWAAGGSGTDAMVYRRTTLDWVEQALPGTPPVLRDICETDTGDLYFVGGNTNPPSPGTVLRRSAGWNNLTLPGSTPALFGCVAVTGGTVYVAGQDGTLLECGLNSCTAMTNTASTEHLRGIWAASASELFAVGLDGTILRSSGGQWTAETSPVTENLLAVWGSSASDVFAVGSFGTILHYDGVDWSVQPSGTGYALQTVWGRSATDVFAAGTNGTVLHFDGTGWAPVRFYLSAALHELQGLGTDLYLAGRDGTTAIALQLLSNGDL